MYESAQSGLPTREEIRQALQCLESALAQHEQPSRDAGQVANPVRDAMERSITVLGEEIEHLRVLLQEDQAGSR